MKKLLFFLGLLFFFFSSQTKAQTWDSVGSGVSFSYGGSSILSSSVYNGELYVGGFFNIAGGIPVNDIARWNGANWNSVGSGVSSLGSPLSFVYSLSVYNGELYTGGDFDTAGGISANNIAKWDGITWDSVGSGVNNFTTSLFVYNGELYTGGLFNITGGITANCIAKWNGTVWDSVGSGVNNVVYSMTVYNGELYIGGIFNITGGILVNNIAKLTNGVLPLELLSFTGENEGNINVLKWKTVSEIGVDYYLIEKSEDRISFEELGKVPAYGYSSLNYYQLVDNNPKEGITYYRLTEISLDDKKGYSDIVAVRKEGDSFIKIYPNIVGDKFTIFVSSLEEDMVLHIFNSIGQKVKTFNITEKVTVISKDTLPAGIYFYQIGKEKGKLVFF